MSLLIFVLYFISMHACFACVDAMQCNAMSFTEEAKAHSKI